MHWLNLPRQADLRFLRRVGGIDDEVDILSIVLPVKIEDLAIIDDDVRFDEL